MTHRNHRKSRTSHVERERARHGRRDVAVVGLRDPEGRLLMIRTRRLPDHWQPIGGGIDPDDATPVDALIRELKEEADIDLVPADLRPVMTARYDFGDGLVHFFEATIDPATMTFNEREILDHRWLPVNAARQLTVFPATKQFLQALA